MNGNSVRLTGLWKEKTKDGDIYLTGTLNQGSRFYVMPNKYKKTDKDPDYNLFLKQIDKQKEGEGQPKANRTEEL